jgi:hypothetical protein
VLRGHRREPRVSAPSIGERIERSPVAQVLIAVAIVAVLLAQLVTHMPPSSAVEDRIGGEADYLAKLVGLEAQWGVFAPNPRSSSYGIEGRVTFEDGAVAVWRLPEGARIAANLRYYRWRKWLERVRSDDYRDLWAPTCQWIATLWDDYDAPVERVRLVRRFHENSLEGPQPPYEEFVYHTCSPPEDGS